MLLSDPQRDHIGTGIQTALGKFADRSYAIAVEYRPAESWRRRYVQHVDARGRPYKHRYIKVPVCRDAFQSELDRNIIIVRKMIARHAVVIQHAGRNDANLTGAPAAVLVL